MATLLARQKQVRKQRIGLSKNESDFTTHLQSI